MGKENGFALVEVIISIAILSVLCVIFLQLFVKADQISERSYRLDRSADVAGSMLEAIKGYDQYEMLETAEAFIDCQFSQDKDDLFINKSLNESFNGTIDDPVYQVTVKLTPWQTIEESNWTLYAVRCQVKETESEMLIYEISTSVILER